jgi:hypothetical protein
MPKAQSPKVVNFTRLYIGLGLAFIGCLSIATGFWISACQFSHWWHHLFNVAGTFSRCSTDFTVWGFRVLAPQLVIAYRVRLDALEVTFRSRICD